jgi:hypothetical protein
LLKPGSSALREVLTNFWPEEIYSRSSFGLVDEMCRCSPRVTNRYVVVQTII